MLIKDGILQERVVNINGRKVPVITKLIEPKPGDNIQNVRTFIDMSPEGVGYHNTANESATALNHVTYFQRVEDVDKVYVGAHIFVDDKMIIQVIPLNEVAWHAGDGYSGEGNRKYVGIEICEVGNINFAEENAIYIGAEILKHYNKTSVKKHQDFSGKYCPRVLLREGRWSAFKRDVLSALDKLKNTPEYDYPEWKMKGIRLLRDVGFVDYDQWIGKLDEDMPVWAAFEIIKDLYIDLKGGEINDRDKNK